MSEELADSTFQRYGSIFIFDSLDEFTAERSVDRARRNMTATKKTIIDEILLYGASHAGATRIVQFLLTLGVKPTFVLDGLNAFHTAVRNWHVDVITLLLRADATLVNEFTTGAVRHAPLEMALSARVDSLFPSCVFERGIYLDFSGVVQKQRRSLLAAVTLLLRSGAVVNRVVPGTGAVATPLKIAVIRACDRSVAAVTTTTTTATTTTTTNGNNVTTDDDEFEIVKQLLVAGNGANDRLYGPLEAPLYCALYSMVDNIVAHEKATVSDAEDTLVARLVRLLLEYGARSDAMWIPLEDNEIIALRLAPGEPLTCALLAVRLGAHRVLQQLLSMSGDCGVLACSFTDNRTLTTLEFVRQYYVHDDVNPQVLAVVEQAQAPDAPLPLSCAMCRVYRDAIPSAALTMIACDHCRCVAYCSEVCKNQHWAARHRHFCRGQQQKQQ